MGESTGCLLSLYSQPCSSSPETKQGDPFRCLTSSISFGRYVTESLDWEKWSTFTENRYMEDVKKYSRPGSVSQMKAHFEAHFKKKAAERAAASLEHNAVCRSNVDQDSMEMESQVSRGKTSEEEETINMVSGSVEVSRYSPRGEGRAPEFVEAEGNQLADQLHISNCLDNVEYDQAIGCNQNIDGREQDSTQFVKDETSFTSDVCVQFKFIENDENGAYSEDGKTQNKTIAELDRKPLSSPFKSRGHIGVAKPPAPPSPSIQIQKRLYRKANSGSRENAPDGENGKKSTRSLHISVDLSPKETKKPFSPILQRLVNSTFKSRGHIGVPKPPAPPSPSVPIQKRQYTKPNSGSRENAADVENRKAPTRSLHKSVHLAPKETKKPLSPILERLVNSRLVKTLAGTAAQATQGKTLRDTVEVSDHPAVSLEHKKISSSKSNSTCTRDVHFHTVSRPFRFKSEERAAKRKEFFGRLEQNAKAKQTGKDNLQENPKVKARNDFKYRHVLATSKVGPCSDSFNTRTTGDASKVISANPRSPFVSGETLKDSNAKPPWRLTASCKKVRGQKKKSPAYPLKSVPKKSPSENASPNILL